MEEKLLTSKELAKELNVSPAAVSKAISKGRILKSIVKKTKEGYLIDKEKAKYEWKVNRQRQHSYDPLNEYDLVSSAMGEYPTQQASIQRKENAMAEIASMRLESLTKDRYELSMIEKIIIENIKEEDQKAIARSIINEFRKGLIEKYRR